MGNEIKTGGDFWLDWTIIFKKQIPNKETRYKYFKEIEDYFICDLVKKTNQTDKIMYAFTWSENKNNPLVYVVKGFPIIIEKREFSKNLQVRKEFATKPGEEGFAASGTVKTPPNGPPPPPIKLLSTFFDNNSFTQIGTNFQTNGNLA
jgi:hypothetical protein